MNAARAALLTIDRRPHTYRIFIYKERASDAQLSKYKNLIVCVFFFSCLRKILYVFIQRRSATWKKNHVFFSLPLVFIDEHEYRVRLMVQKVHMHAI